MTKHQLVTHDGELLEAPLASYLETLGATQWSSKYQVVAIMGPQSSGKSTLLNHVFGTDFQMMDESRGRSQTTKGVWLAKSPKDNAYGPTLIMDLEGTDGRERGEDDTKFEKQSSLFAMATADTLLVNIWCHDIGRENASGKPLLKTIFQVILKIFNPKKTTLLFVIRDKTSKTPMDALVRDMRTDLQSIWQSVTKPSKHARASFDDFFTLEFTSLPHYEYAHDQFIEESNALYGRFADPNRRDTLCPVADGSNVPANGLVVSLRETWNAVVGDKDLNLPAHKVMVATVRCEEIAAAKLAAMCEGRELASLMSSVQEGTAPPGLGLKLAAHAIIALRGYDEEAQYFDESVRVAKRDELRTRLVHALKPIAFEHLKRVREKLLRRLRNAMAASKDSFAFVSAGATKEAREEWANAAGESDLDTWRAVANRVTDDFEKLLAACVADERKTRVGDATRACERTMERAVGSQVTGLIEDPPEDLWERLDAVLATSARRHCKALHDALKGFEPSADEATAASTAMATRVREVVEAKTRDAAEKATELMKTAFARVFSKDSRGLPRTWKATDDVAAANRRAQREAVRVLGLLAVSRLGKPDGPDGDKQDAEAQAQRQDAIDAALSTLVQEPEDDDHWVDEDENAVMLTPQECRSAWRKFEADTAYAVSQALAAREAAARGGAPAAPAWMIAALIVTGFDEAMWLLRNPITLLFLVAAGLFLRAMYNNMDVETAMRMGVVPGLMFLATKVVPTAMAILKKLWEEGAMMHGIQPVGSVTGSAQVAGHANAAGGDASIAAGGEKERVFAPSVSGEGVRVRKKGE
ncbi:predicted protein [Micromonas commoda]|uniref:Protein ROOT HAIR DEFECTIVE 3 homolog n=1 Tax=Micromonas commoda (strain RCC299 / NOUM17 / CCMP2709) TaxID=296587 RepID=C1ED20_MICCC|nr:predicted protein [Micromonas commoda]ACO66003.1 predicted protein [Micromonas commoda]|eukprot:XP_002504745.1 predicted protein [Micromonas commoda]